MKKQTVLICLLMSLILGGAAVYSQVPQGITYQAVARNAQGNLIINTPLTVKIGILSDTLNNIYVWEEQHSVTTTPQGILSLIVGSGTKLQGSATAFSDINWVALPLWLRTQINYQGSWKNMGTTRIWSTPYSIVSGKSDGLTPGAKLSVVSNNDATTDALFEVKRKDGQPVFQVYPDAVNIFVPNGVKGSKGGFAIGGFNQAKAYSQDYFRVTADSIRAYINNTPGKGSKGGFAIGGFNEAKAGTFVKNYFMNVSGSSSIDTVKGSPQILWYPNKNAFLAGNVYIASKDSVGLYSTALGYRSLAMGDYSQAFGYKAKAFGDYSTSIGRNSIAGARTGAGRGTSSASNAFAFGNASKATGEDSYAFGSGAIASGYRAFAFGSVGIDEATGNATTTPTTANQPYTFAIGMGAQATQKGAMALGIGSLSSGFYANSFGFYSTSSGNYATALGYRSTASGYYSAALGRSAQANGLSSIALGYSAIAGGSSAVSLGVNSNASGASSMALGVNTIASGSTSTAVGYAGQAIAQNAVAFGNSNISNGTFTITLGNSNTAGTASNAIALGNNNVSSGSYSVALGNSNTSSNSYSIAIGTSTTSSNSYSTAIGYLAEALGSKSISIGARYTYNLIPKPIIFIPRLIIMPKGEVADPDPNAIPAGGDNSGKGFIPIYNMSRNNIADGTYSLAVGNGNSSTNGGLTFGVYNSATALYATGIGFQNNADGPYSFAGGYLNQTTGDFSTAFGRSTEAQSENVFVIGRYNYIYGNSTEWVDSDPLFQIGNGNSTSETHDAFRMLKNGGAYFYPTNAYYGLYLYNTTNSSSPYTYHYGVRATINRGKAGATYYSGWFYDTGVEGTYGGLYADVRSGGAIDVAEYILDTYANTSPADVVVADPLNKESIIKSSQPYQAGVLGVISTNPHLTMGMEIVADEQTGEMKKGVNAARLALTGRVPVNVSGENGSIVPGDYLTTSSIAGFAMKWTLLDVKAAKDFEELKSILAENERRRNTIIGKAVESFPGSGTGKIMVLISLQ